MNDLRDAGLFSLRSGQQQNRARAKEQNQACTRQRTVENRFHGSLKSKRKRESATDISKRRKNRGSTESRPTRVRAMSLLIGGGALRSPRTGSNQSKRHCSSTE